MKNLFNFSKIIAILLLVFFAIRVLSLLVLPEDISNIIGKIYDKSILLIWAIWFILIITAATKKSSLKIPAILGIIGCLSVVLYSLFNIPSEELIDNPLKMAINITVRFVYFILFAIAILWIRKYFEKKSKVKTLALFIVIFPIFLYAVRFCLNMYISPMDIDHQGYLTYLYADLIILSIQIVLYSWFFYEFYKISECRDNTFIKALN